MDFELNPKQVFRLLIGVAVFLIAMHTLLTVLKIEFGYGFGRRLFNLNAEESIPTVFSVLILFFSSTLLLLIGLKERRRGLPCVLWLLLAAIFLFLTIDEGAYIHEELRDPIREKYDLEGFLVFAWVIPYFAFFVLVGLLYLRFLLGLPRRIMWLFVVGGLVYVGGAIGMEMIGGKVVQLFGPKGWPLAIAIIFEESMEMVGVIVFILGLTSYIAEEQRGMHIGLKQ